MNARWMMLSLSVCLCLASCMPETGSEKQSDSDEAETPLADAGGTGAPAVEVEVADTLREGPFDLRIADRTLSVPKGWKEVSLTKSQEGLGFYYGRMKLPAAGSLSELTISIVGGGVDANLRRWEETQFPVEDPRRVELDTPGENTIFIDLTGPIKPGGRTPVDDNRMLGAAIPLDQGQDCYIKLIGTAGAMEQLREPFRKFLESQRLTP